MIRATNVKVKTWSKKTYNYKEAVVTRTNMGVLIGGDGDRPGSAKSNSKWFPMAMIKEITFNGNVYDFKKR